MDIHEILRLGAEILISSVSFYTPDILSITLHLVQPLLSSFAGFSFYVLGADSIVCISFFLTLGMKGREGKSLGRMFTPFFSLC